MNIQREERERKRERERERREREGRNGGKEERLKREELGHGSWVVGIAGRDVFDGCQESSRA